VFILCPRSFQLPGICASLRILFLVVSLIVCPASGIGDSSLGSGRLRPTASVSKLVVGDVAPDFSLSDLSGNKVSLGSFRGAKNVVISFVPAAWTPVCSQQWPGYNVAKELFDKHDAVLLGITVDNKPTLVAWTQQFGRIWFPVLSDFWPHGAVAGLYGVLRDDGVSERALFVIDKSGVIRYIDVHDIRALPKLDDLVGELEKIRN
jgi:peroxiredoxin